MSADTIQPQSPRAAFAAGREFLEDLVRKLVAGVPPLAGAAGHDVALHFRRVLKEQLAQLDLCSRTEFDAQERLLAHTRQQLAALEARVALLEQRAAGSSPPVD